MKKRRNYKKEAIALSMALSYYADDGHWTYPPASKPKFKSCIEADHGQVARAALRTFYGPNTVFYKCGGKAFGPDE